jgi:hypothetical protein
VAIGKEDKWMGIIKCDLQTLNWHNKWLHVNYCFKVNYQILCNEKKKNIMYKVSLEEDGPTNLNLEEEISFNVRKL